MQDEHARLKPERPYDDFEKLSYTYTLCISVTMAKG